MPLFAEVPDWVPWLSTAAGSAIVWAATWFATRRKEKRAEDKEDEKGIVAHQGETIKRLSHELDEVRVRCDKQGALIGRMLGHIGYLEGLMTAKGGMEFKRFDLDGTAEHIPLPSGGK